MSVLVHGKPEEIPGLLTRGPSEDPSLLLTTEDRGPRPKLRIRSIVVHTTEGRWPQVVMPTAGAPGASKAYIDRAARDHRCAAAHLWIDRDGVVFCSADLADHQTWHATSINPWSIGIEIAQHSDGRLYRPQLEVLVVLVDWLTRRFRIQRQIPREYIHGKPVDRLIHGGRDFVGVCGHRDQTHSRGRGDPGDHVFEYLAAAGYEQFDLHAGEDLARWKSRQVVLGFRDRDVDGIALDKTCDALEATGKLRGLWVERPGDRL